MLLKEEDDRMIADALKDVGQHVTALLARLARQNAPDVAMEVAFRNRAEDMLARKGEVEICSIRLRLEDKGGA